MLKNSTHPILKIKPLGFQWETSDPFLFCSNAWPEPLEVVVENIASYRPGSCHAVGELTKPVRLCKLGKIR